MGRFSRFFAVMRNRRIEHDCKCHPFFFLFFDFVNFFYSDFFWNFEKHASASFFARNLFLILRSLFTFHMVVAYLPPIRQSISFVVFLKIFICFLVFQSFSSSSWMQLLEALSYVPYHPNAVYPASLDDRRHWTLVLDVMKNDVPRSSTYFLSTAGNWIYNSLIFKWYYDFERDFLSFGSAIFLSRVRWRVDVTLCSGHELSFFMDESVSPFFRVMKSGTKQK